MVKNIAAITTCRNDALFLRKWLDYYGDQFGAENLFVVLDGHDQDVLGGAHNTIRLPHQPLPRVPAMRRRARVMSDMARGLHRYFDIVIATDVDEFLVLDPAHNASLADYLSGIKGVSSISGLGLDIGQHIEREAALDPDQPFLAQRRFAHLSARYTKPSTSFQPLTWGSGMHRIKGRNFRIDPFLFHLHFGMVDYALATGKTADKDRLKTGWGKHLGRREKLFKIIAESDPKPGDDIFEDARNRQSRRRPIFALNKPGMLKDDPVAILPKRFQSLNI